MKNPDTIPMLNGKIVNAVAFRPGKVNQHFDASNKRWMTDDDGVSGAISVDNTKGIVQYCQKFYPNTKSIASL
jgi:hypothetical protein